MLVVATMFTFDCNTYAQIAGKSSNLLTEVQTIPLQGVEGRIDHFGLDAKHKRLFLAALGNDSVEVVDLATGTITAAINPASGTQIADVKLDAHPESFQLETKGKRIFVNVPGAGHVVVVDRKTGRIVAKFAVIGASANFPMALDEADHRLFIGCRSPAKVLVLDTETGRTIAALDIVRDTDDLFYDPANKRIYVSGGEGRITVVGQTNADTYKVLGEVATAPGARTSLFVPKTGALYVAVPHRGTQKAELHVFTAAPAQ